MTVDGHRNRARWVVTGAIAATATVQWTPAAALPPSTAPAAQLPSGSQQDCYAGQHPTCTMPPPPSGLLTSLYTTAPTASPTPSVVISE
ncbi:MAG TPA: hypothetical protein VHZ03_42205 [Trebonia sp.]|nr:hypothetical protein [Trebonia sp.]